MGLHLSVLGAKNLLDLDCSTFIDKNYYNFTTSYELYGNESVLIRSGEYFGLDLKGLGLHLYVENESDLVNNSDYLKQHQIEINCILPILQKFKSAIQLESDFLKKVKFNFGDKINHKLCFEEYTSFAIIEDLNNVIESIKCHLDNGESYIYFYVG